MKNNIFKAISETERLQNEEKYLCSLEAVYKIFIEVKKSQYLKFFFEHEFLINIALQFKDKFETYTIEKVLAEIVNNENSEISINENTRIDMINAGRYILLNILNLVNKPAGKAEFSFFDFFSEALTKEDFEKKIDEIHTNYLLTNAYINFLKLNIFSFEVLRPISKIIMKSYKNVGLDFFLSLPLGNNWEKYKITKNVFFELLYKLPQKEAFAALKYIPELDYTELVDIYKNKNMSQFIEITKNINIDYISACCNCYATFISIINLDQMMKGGRSLSFMVKKLASMINFTKRNNYSVDSLSDSDLYFLFHDFFLQFENADDKRRIELMDKCSSILQKNMQLFCNFLFVFLDNNTNVILLEDSFKIQEIIQNPKYKKEIEQARQDYLSSIKSLSNETIEGYDNSFVVKIIKRLNPFFKLTPADGFEKGKCFRKHFLLDLIQIASTLTTYYDIHGFAYILYYTKCFDFNRIEFNKFVDFIMEIFPLSHVKITSKPYPLSKSGDKAKKLKSEHLALKALAELDFTSKEK